jgi:hypothetical protein
MTALSLLLSYILSMYSTDGEGECKFTCGMSLYDMPLNRDLSRALGVALAA